MYNYTAYKSLKTPSHSASLVVLHVSRLFSCISTLTKMFRNGGLNPFEKHRSQTPIPLRYITGIELN